MSFFNPSDETLMAYADGELDESAAAEIERAMRGDPEIVVRAVQFIRSRRLARSAYWIRETAEVPQALKEAIGRAAAKPAERVPPGKPVLLAWGRLPLAAAALALLIGLAGYFAGSNLWRTSEAGDDPMLALLSDPDIRGVLDRIPSGESRHVGAGEVSVIGTYRMADGSLCREFSITDQATGTGAVACRSGAQWRLALAVGGLPAGDAYLPAGGEEVRDVFLDEAGASQALAGPEELAALAN